jgi:hypothetical protein
MPAFRKVGLNQSLKDNRGFDAPIEHLTARLQGMKKVPLRCRRSEDDLACALDAPTVATLNDLQRMHH